MKKFVCSVLLVAASVYANAQLQFVDSVNISRDRWRDSIFRMNKSSSQIPTGILLEYSMFPFDANKFDGINNDDDTVKTEGEIFALHNLLKLGKVNANSTLAVTDSIYARANRSQSSTGANPFILIYQPYNRIRQSSLSEGLFKIASDSVGILDVANRPVSPYDSYNFFAVSPLNLTITQFNSVSFTFPNSLWLMTGISSVSVDFGDGAGFRNITKGGTVSVYYSTVGTKIITAQITTAEGTKTAKTAVTYTRPATFLQPSFSWTISVPPVYTNDDDYFGRSVAPLTPGGILGTQPGANVEVENGCDNIFNKPIIIVEGFDPDGSLSLDELRSRFDVQKFRETMKAAGYDFVYVEFTDNTTYIENNAKVLEEVINKVNQTKTGNFKSSIIGFSMGGLVARWCLKDMEDRSLAHNVSNYFSYDAPHQGANIPLGYQFFFKEITRDAPYLKWFNIGGLGDLADAYDKPAAREMLVTKASYNNAIDWTPDITTLDDLRAEFALRLKNKGYPQQTVNYGISFGRGDNTANTKDAGNGVQWNNFQPGSLLFDGGMNWFLAAFDASVYAVPENGNQNTICNYYFTGLTFRKIFGIPFIPQIRIRYRNFKYTGQYPYDDAPGGFELTGQIFANSLSGLANGIAPDANVFGHYGHDFVPVASALDLQNQGYSATNKWQSNNMFYTIDNLIQNPGTVTGNTLSTPSRSPFRYVVTATSDCGSVGCSDWNQYHNGDLQNQFAQFIIRKILNAIPSFACQSDAFCSANPSISGPQLVCTTGNYTLLNLPGGVSINWIPVNNIVQITSGQGTPSITVQKANAGNEIIRAVVTSSCGASKIIDFPIHVGGYSSGDYPVSGPSSACKNTYVTYTTNTLVGATSYTWFYPGSPWTYVSGQNTNTLTLITGTTTGSIGVRVANTCDAGGSPAMATTFVNNCGGFAINTSPNPTPGNILVSVENSNEKSISKEQKIYEIRVVDSHGVTKKKYKYLHGVLSTNINLNNLINGTYFIKAYNGVDWTVNQVVLNY